MIECSDPATLSALIDINLFCEELINKLGNITAGKKLKINSLDYNESN